GREHAVAVGSEERRGGGRSHAVGAGPLLFQRAEGGVRVREGGAVVAFASRQVVLFLAQPLLVGRELLQFSDDLLLVAAVGASEFRQLGFLLGELIVLAVCRCALLAGVLGAGDGPGVGALCGGCGLDLVYAGAQPAVGGRLVVLYSTGQRGR